MGDVTTLNRTLDQELLALLRGVSLECLVCGEFVQHRAGGTIACPQCGLMLRGCILRAEAAGKSRLQSEVQAG